MDIEPERVLALYKDKDKAEKPKHFRCVGNQKKTANGERGLCQKLVRKLSKWRS